MTKKDCQLIAQVLRYDVDNASLYPDTEVRLAGCKDRARRMAVALSKTNPLFNRSKFLADCGVSDD